MEQKKEPKLVIERYRGMHLSLGLMISLSLVITAFEWKTPYRKIDLYQSSGEKEPEELVVLTVQPPPPPPPKPVVVQPVVVESSEDQMEMPEVEIVFDPDPDITYDIPEPEPEPEPVYTTGVIERNPEPVGGMDAFYAFLSKEIKYPRPARQLEVEGKVFIQFIIDKDGSITEIEVIKGIGAGCDEEALRVMKLAPRWNPGKQRGQPVKVRMVVPVYFKLQ
ncbi:MAG: energy transducer TonB [Cyclobacteriaceae bacterium]|nr:energy transducer TonB [Cyclobacteriaceae bacterium]